MIRDILPSEVIDIKITTMKVIEIQNNHKSSLPSACPIFFLLVSMLTNATTMTTECATELYCGVPLYSGGMINGAYVVEFKKKT